MNHKGKSNFGVRLKNFIRQKLTYKSVFIRQNLTYKPSVDPDFYWESRPLRIY